MNINKTLEKIVMRVEGSKEDLKSSLALDNNTYSYKLPAKTIASKIKVITVK